MKLDIYITAEGLEHLVRDEQLYSWHFVLRLQESNSFETRPKNSLPVVIGVELTLPSRESAIEPAKAALEARIQETYAEAETNVRELKERLQNLLALPAPQGDQT